MHEVGTVDGDDIVEESLKEATNGFRIGGVLYNRPNYIGRSFTTTVDDESAQDEYFIGKNYAPLPERGDSSDSNKQLSDANAKVEEIK